MATTFHLHAAPTAHAFTTQLRQLHVQLPAQRRLHPRATPGSTCKRELTRIRRVQRYVLPFDRYRKSKSAVDKMMGRGFVSVMMRGPLDMALVTMCATYNSDTMGMPTDGSTSSNKHRYLAYNGFCRRCNCSRLATASQGSKLGSSLLTFHEINGCRIKVCTSMVPCAKPL